MIEIAVIVPAAPLLLPGVTGRPVPEVEVLRAACVDALSAMRGAARVVVVGPVTVHGRVAPGLAGASAGPVVALEVGRALLGEAGVDLARVEFLGLAAPEQLGMAARLDGDADPIGLVVVADGTPCGRRAGSPVAFDPRAPAFDDAMLAALGGPDPAALTALDAGLAAALQVAGCLPLQFLAQAMPTPRSAQVSYSGRPFGVFYVVARWSA